jgi:hypothetical protein
VGQPTTRAAAVNWLQSHRLELLLLLAGVLLRISMRFRYKPAWGYDSSAHWDYVEWLIEHRSLPPILMDNSGIFEAFHPPLFYAVSAVLAACGMKPANVAWVSILAGSARLALIWWGLERYLPRQIWARRSALALAAVLPASVHLEGMLTAEPLNGLFAAGVMVVAPPLLTRPTSPRWALRALAAGCLLGLALLTKISGLVLAAGLASTLALALWHERRSGVRHLLLRIRPLAIVFATCIALCGWYYARNVSQFGRPFVTSFETTESSAMSDLERTPVLDRRPLGFVLGWDWDIYEFPYWPSAMQPHARFFPTTLASTFVDYWNYSFSGIPPSRQLAFSSNDRPISPHLLRVSRLSVVGGTVITLAALIAWARGLRRSLLRRDWDVVALLMFPLLTLLASLKFAIQYPFDLLGVIKAVYMQFGMPPFFVMFGVAVQWSCARPLRQPLLWLLLASLGSVALYTFTCRTGLGL